MTREEIMQMDMTQINIAIADKIMGLTVKLFESEHMGKPISAWMVFEKLAGFDMPIKLIPEYTNNMSLAYEVEEKIKEMGVHIRNYTHEICNIVGVLPYTEENLFTLIHATPEQRCRAALLCITNKEER